MNRSVAIEEKQRAISDIIKSLEFGGKYIISVKFLYKESGNTTHSLSFLLVQCDILGFQAMKFCIVDELEEMYRNSFLRSIKLRIREVC